MLAQQNSHSKSFLVVEGRRDNNYRKKTAAKLVLLVAIFLFLLIPFGFVLAANVDVGLNAAANIGLPDPGGRDIKQLLVDIVKYFLTFLVRLRSNEPLELL